MAVTIQSHALITLAEYVAIAADPNADSDRTTTIINYISKSIAKYCNRDLISTEHTEYYDGHNEEFLHLNNWPILDSDDSVSDPVVTIDANYDGTFQATSTFGMTVQWESTKTMGALYLKYRERWPRGTRNIKVVYTAGYANTAAVPENLKNACAEIVAVSKKKFEHNMHGVQSISTMSDTTTFRLDEWPATARQIIDAEKRIIV